jgi:serine/threonine protein kinase
MESEPNKRGAQGDAKRQAIARLVRQVMADVAAGKTFDEAALIATHPELMPELQAELQRIRAAKSPQAGGAVNATMLPPAAGATAVSSQLAAQTSDATAVGIPGYVLQREIGRGGQAIVYLATQQSTGRKVAVKLIRKDALADDRALARFKREVQVLAALEHPNIVGIIDTGAASDGSQFIVMSYVAGATLDEYMKVVQASPDRSKLLRLFLKICDAVNVAHLRGIVHRDLKPANIRIDERGEPHVLDFGLAHTALDHLAGAEHPKSIDGEFLGSIPWSSPEQAAADPQRIDIRSDVYSLGVILYQIITSGKFPYEVVGNIRDVLNNILSVPPTPPSKIAAPDPNPINPAMEKIVLKALAKNREERYQSAGELGRDVARYLAGQRMSGRQATAETPPPPAPAKSGAKGIAFAAVGGAILCALAIGIGFYLHKNRLAQASPTIAAPIVTPPATLPSATSQPAVATAARQIFVDHVNNGTIHIDGDTIALNPGPRGQCSVYFGSRTWSDYDLTFQVITNGLRGFWIQPHTLFGEFDELVINAFEDNIALSSHAATALRRISQPRHLRLEPDRWYDVRLQVRGPDIQLFINGQAVYSVRDEAITRGAVAIGTRNPSARFRDIKVASPAGDPMWDAKTHLPNIDPSELDTENIGAPPSYHKTNLISLVHPRADGRDGIWLLRAGILSGQGPGAQLHFPYSPSGEYDYRISVNRVMGIQPVALIATQNGHPFAWVVGGHRDTLAGFAMVDGRDYDLNITTREGQKWLGNEAKVTLVLRVAKDSVTAYVDGQQAGFYKTDFSDMSLPATWYHQASPTPGIWLGGDHVAIDSADVLTYAVPFDAPPTTGPSTRPRGEAGSNRFEQN